MLAHEEGHVEHFLFGRSNALFLISHRVQANAVSMARPLPIPTYSTGEEARRDIVDNIQMF
jgi:hypothetical protein